MAWQGGLIVLLTLLTYIPALSGELIWDDDANIINSVALRSLDGLRRIWFEPGATQQYYPLTHSSFWVEYQLWGLNPFHYHLINILLHAFSAVLFWRVLARLGVREAWLAAAVFAVHPVCAETVAWVTERKNTLSGCFFLGSLLAAVCFWIPQGAEESSSSSVGKLKYYWLALALYVCALWSKTAAVPLPAVILLLLWWKRRTSWFRNLALLAPFFAAGLGLAMITVWVERHHLLVAGNLWGLSAWDRVLLAARVAWFYLGKLVWPHPLSFMYPRWEIHALHPLAYVPLVAALAGLSVLWRNRDGWARSALFAFGYFIAMLLPIIGFLDTYFFRYSFVNDHFQYLAALGPLALGSACITWIFHCEAGRRTVLQPVLCGTLLLLLMAATWQHAGVFRTVETLWSATVAENPDSWVAQNNLGLELMKKGQAQEGLMHLRRALQLDPDHLGPYYNLGSALAVTGQLEEAVQYLRGATTHEPNRLDGDFPSSADAHYNLALTLSLSHRFAEAIIEYKKTLELRPQMTNALNNLAWMLATDSDVTNRNGAEAVRLAEQACQLTGNREAAYVGTLGAAYAEDGRFDDAVATAQQAEALATAAGREDLATKNHDMLELFKSHRPFRQPTASPGGK